MKLEFAIYNYGSKGNLKLGGVWMENMDKWLRLFNTSNPDVKLRVAKNLIEYYEDMPIEILLEIFDKFHNKRLGADTERIILKRKDPELRNEMLKRLFSTSPFVKQVACRYIGICMNINDLPELIKVLSDENNMVRLSALNAIGKINDTSCTEDLLIFYKSFINSKEHDLSESNVKWFVECVEWQLQRFGINIGAI